MADISVKFFGIWAIKASLLRQTKQACKRPLDENNLYVKTARKVTKSVHFSMHFK